MAKLLVVDDSKLMRTVLGACLREAGHTVEEVAPASLADLLRHLKRESFDLVLTDYEMPAFTGEQLLRAIRSDEQLAVQRVLMLTSHHEAELVERLGQLRLDAYLTKPLVAVEVVGRVRELVAG